MAQRTVALCNGKYIGIETIFTVIVGKQINIPEKLKELRAKSDNKELFCPCGCGANLILVAGDKNLREQHFRIRDGGKFDNCSVITEGKSSIDSKIVLKCWLDDNLHADDLESRVPICDVTDSDRRYEFTFISKSMGIALDYCHNRLNLSDEKQIILEQNSQGIRIIHIVDHMNGGCNGQYPEGLMKVQNNQGYCLLLTVSDADYDTAMMKAVFYAQDIDGLWQEGVLSIGLLKDYRIDKQGALYYHGEALDRIHENAIRKFQKAINDEKIARAIASEVKRREEEKSRIEAEKALEEKHRREERFLRDLASNIDQQERQVCDSEGNRWIKCEICGKIAKDSEFSSYGGAVGVHLNLGTCKECSQKHPDAGVLQHVDEHQKVQRNNNLDVCPDCGGKLVERNGRNGSFIGCMNFPRCRYTRSIHKQPW